MAILEVRKSDNRNLQNIANTLAAAKKIVIITGAGISTNCGVPDFRSEDGLYSLIQAQYDLASTSETSNDSLRKPYSCVPPAKTTTSSSRSSLPTNVKGKDLFDSQLWSDPTSTSVFYRFVSSFREKIRQDVKHTTSTHRFIRMLRDRRKLVRCYTQNIDGLESREGLSTDLRLGKGNRRRFTKKSMERPLVSIHTRPGGDLDPGCEVVQLHGDLETLRCTLCQETCSWDAQHLQHRRMLLEGTAPLCQLCLATDQDRQDRGKRSTKIGTLRPNVVLYGEERPFADVLGSIITHDLTLSPDVLLVLGTSLHVHGLKTLVREFAKSVHARPGGRGKVIFINLSRPSESVWKDMLDYWLNMECDAWVSAMRKHRSDLFHTQEELKMPIGKAINRSTSMKLSAPLAEIDRNKENNVGNASVSGLQDKTSKPRVVVPATPRKKPLQEREAAVASPARVRVAYEGMIALSPSGTLSSLPQPLKPSSPSIDTSAKKRRRTLAMDHNEMSQTPCKRRRAPVTIWSDVGATWRSLVLND